MYYTLLTTHSLFRWLVLASLILSITIGLNGWLTNKHFNKTHNSIRHWTATIAHIQLMLGITLYSISPLIKTFWNGLDETIKMKEIRFFGMEHSLMMFIAVVIITIGSAKAKRKENDISKFKTMTIWFLVGLIIILVNIPWGFSFFVSRPYFRLF